MKKKFTRVLVLGLVLVGHTTSTSSKPSELLNTSHFTKGSADVLRGGRSTVRQKWVSALSAKIREHREFAAKMVGLAIGVAVIVGSLYRYRDFAVVQPAFGLVRPSRTALATEMPRFGSKVLKIEPASESWVRPVVPYGRPVLSGVRPRLSHVWGYTHAMGICLKTVPAFFRYAHAMGTTNVPTVAIATSASPIITGTILNSISGYVASALWVWASEIAPTVVHCVQQIPVAALEGAASNGGAGLIAYNDFFVPFLV
jgi:hypothetical protein